MSVKRKNTIMGINKGAISTLLILSMVAVQVLSTGSESGKESKVYEQSAASFAKAFSTATKLDRGTYTIWIASNCYERIAG